MKTQPRACFLWGGNATEHHHRDMIWQSKIWEKGKKWISHWFKSERNYTVLTAFNLCNLQFSVSGVVHGFGTAFTDIQKYVWITSKIFIGVCVNDYDPTLKLLGKVIKQVEIWSADSSSSTTANLSHALPLSCTSPQTVKLWKVLSGSDTRRSMINDRHG